MEKRRGKKRREKGKEEKRRREGGVDYEIEKNDSRKAATEKERD